MGLSLVGLSLDEVRSGVLWFDAARKCGWSDGCADAAGDGESAACGEGTKAQADAAIGEPGKPNHFFGDFIAIRRLIAECFESERIMVKTTAWT